MNTLKAISVQDNHAYISPLIALNIPHEHAVFDAVVVQGDHIPALIPLNVFTLLPPRFCRVSCFGAHMTRRISQGSAADRRAARLSVNSQAAPSRARERHAWEKSAQRCSRNRTSD